MPINGRPRLSVNHRGFSGSSFTFGVRGRRLSPGYCAGSEVNCEVERTPNITARS